MPRGHDEIQSEISDSQRYLRSHDEIQSRDLKISCTTASGLQVSAVHKRTYSWIRSIEQALRHSMVSVRSEVRSSHVDCYVPLAVGSGINCTFSTIVEGLATVLCSIVSYNIQCRACSASYSVLVHSVQSHRTALVSLTQPSALSHACLYSIATRVCIPFHASSMSAPRTHGY